MEAAELALVDGQIAWRGLVLGAGTPYGWRGLDGWLDLPGTRGDDLKRPGQHGAYPGRLLAEPRVVTFTWVLRGANVERTGRAGFVAAVEALRRATALDDNPVEEQLVVSLDGQQHMAVARCIRRSIPADLGYGVGHSTGAIQWRATDPRLFELPRLSTSTRLAAPAGGGLVFPMVPPLRFGAGRQGGQLTAHNAGTAPAWPVWRITGPCLGPMITCTTSGRRLAFDPQLWLPEGQTLEIDTAERTVLTAESGVSRSAMLWTREWFPIPAGGACSVAFTAAEYSPDAELTCLLYNTSI